jgi:hypothetical protein
MSAAGWVVLDHPEITPPSNFHHLYDTTRQLAEEAERVSARAAQAFGVQDQKATGDAVATGVSLVLFWPAMFFIKGDGASAAEVARLKGEMETIEQASIRKNCRIEFQKVAVQG